LPVPDVETIASENMSKNVKQPSVPRPSASESEASDIPEFTVVVRRLMKEAKRDHIACSFDNLGPAHARVVVNTMIENAERSVCIFARELSREVYDASVLKEFLARCSQGVVRIVVENRAATNSATSALPDLQAEINQGRIYLHTLDCSDGVDHDGENLCIVDNLHVRFEENQTSREATVFFGDSEIGIMAADRFRAIEKQAS
jgi:hypothetical protein